ncbi:unnamed protein product [marine sediment metagenome]|uniref:Uncharacterized protein n=1 Tax=marine sediment metagenome TaxID=412755 RepID=X1DK05_9ZZZZ
MLDKKATETTNQILGLLQLPKTTFAFVTIQPIILDLLTSTYLLGRKDQVNKVVFEEGPEGSITFPSQK